MASSTPSIARPVEPSFIVSPRYDPASRGAVSVNPYPTIKGNFASIRNFSTYREIPAPPTPKNLSLPPKVSISFLPAITFSLRLIKGDLVKSPHKK